MPIPREHRDLLRRGNQKTQGPKESNGDGRSVGNVDNVDMNGHGCAASDKPSANLRQTHVQTHVQIQAHIYGPVSSIVETYISNFTGTFSIRNIGEYLKSNLGIDVLTRQINQALYESLRRRVLKGHIERTCRGGYRIICNEFEFLDSGQGETEHGIKLPLSLNELVFIEPKEVILVCGDTDGGKTCFAISVGVGNKRHTYVEKEKGFKDLGIFHFVSEMGGTSFRNKMESIREGMDAEYRSQVAVLRFNPDSILDQIQPQSINIVDYLEPPRGDFRELAPMVNAIFDRLTTGVAVLCVQMRGDLPAGGTGMFWRPRLVVGLTNQKERGCKMAKIIKGKNNRMDHSIDGYELDFWITNKGTHFVEKTGWESPYGRTRKKYTKI